MQMFQMNLPEMQFKWIQCRRINWCYFNMTVNYLPAPLYFINNQFLPSIIYLLHLLQTYISSTQGALLIFLHMLLWFEWRLFFFFTRTHSFSFTISVPHLKYKWLTLSADFSDWQGNTCRIYVCVRVSAVLLMPSMYLLPNRMSDVLRCHRCKPNVWEQIAYTQTLSPCVSLSHPDIHTFMHCT